MKAFDVVLVPDFSGPSAAAFEARSLLFLGSWIENAGRARDFPLHLACIGEPPATVRSLARRCNASISIHPPVPRELGVTSNKLRGLEVAAQTDRVLLLDTDVVVLSDPSELATWPCGIAASPTSKPRLSEESWRRLYGALGMELPSERIASIRGELGCGRLGRESYPGQDADLESMLPYHNSGVLLAPWKCGLRELWEEHTRVASRLIRPAKSDDQIGLATAIEKLRRQGVPFSRLPCRYNYRWLHIYRSDLAVRDVALFHALRIFRGVDEATSDLGREIERYRLHVARRMLKEWRREDHDRWQAVVRHLVPSLFRVHAVGRVLRGLHRRHVRGAAQAGSARSSMWAEAGRGS